MRSTRYSQYRQYTVHHCGRMVTPYSNMRQTGEDLHAAVRNNVTDTDGLHPTATIVVLYVYTHYKIR